MLAVIVKSHLRLIAKTEETRYKKEAMFFSDVPEKQQQLLNEAKAAYKRSTIKLVSMARAAIEQVDGKILKKRLEPEWFELDNGDLDTSVDVEFITKDRACDLLKVWKKVQCEFEMNAVGRLLQKPSD